MTTILLTVTVIVLSIAYVRKKIRLREAENRISWLRYSLDILAPGHEAPPSHRRTRR